MGEGWFADISQVPTRAISMSPRQILKAKELLVVVPDQRKAEAVKACLEGEISPMAPASILRRHPNATVYLDTDSASLLSPALQGRWLKVHKRWRRNYVNNPEMASARKPIPSLRWWIGGLLFASTVINYIDRQTLSLLAPYLKLEYHWTNSDYANIAIAFRVAYSIGQTGFGKLMDRIGTRRGLTLSVIGYSTISMLTSLASGFYSFATFRFLLGAGESANWPAATKAVSEWFPKRERALATALFDSGSSIGGAVAPFIVLWIYFRWGWRPAFMIPGTLGFLWLIAWRWLYYPPEEHPRISAG